MKPIKAHTGLFSCPYCQEKLVVCQSGHYVRDPFIWKQIVLSSSLRRQSQPLARIIRDFVLFKSPLLALLAGGAIILGTIALTQESTNYQQQTLPDSHRTR
jgi:hypothetical protein